LIRLIRSVIVFVVVIVIVRTDRRTIDRRNGRSRAPVETEVV